MKKLITKKKTMKKSFFFLLIAVCVATLINAQPPQSFTYQAVVRDAAGDILANQSIKLRITIQNNTPGGPIVYQETHNVITNQFGLVTLNIGKGTIVIGSFTFINWSIGSKFIETEMNDGGGYISMGITELSSVPYALYSGGSSDSYWDLNSSDVYYNYGNVGIGTSNPKRELEVRGNWQLVRLSTKSSGPFLEFEGSSYTDWGIGVWSNVLRVISSTDTFNTINDEFAFGTSYFRPFYGNSKNLGTSSQRWMNLFSNDGDFTGEVNVMGHINGNQSSLGGLNIHDGVNSFASLFVTPETSASGDSSMIFLAEDDEASYGMYWLYDGGGNHMELWGRALNIDYGPHMVVERSDGDMAIGGSTMATGYKVSIHGDLICEEVRVTLVADWPDYVFKKDYDLMTIRELGDYIENNGHLPDVPPASEIEEEGFEVGDMQKVMLQKVEELSLYIIEQNKKLDSHSQLIIEQNKKLDSHSQLIIEQKKEIESLKLKINKKQ